VRIGCDERLYDAELAYLTGQRHLARIGAVGSDGTPHVVPVGWTYSAERDAIDVGDGQMESTKKFRDVTRSARTVTA
jgi:pyridoxamine 5'-phosphate oxidase family protein